MWVYFWALYSTSFIYLSILSTIPHFHDYKSFTVGLEVRSCQSSNFVLLLLYCAAYSEFFASSYKL